MLGKGDIHVDSVLTNMSVRYQPEGYIADKLFPVVSVVKDSDVFYVYDKSNMRRENSIRADGTESKMVEHSYSTQGYSCDYFALHEKVTDRQKKNVDKPLNLEIDAAMTVKDKLMLDLEYAMAAKATTTSNYNVANYATISTKWGTYSTSTPRTDIQTGIDAVRLSIGKVPNLLIIGYPVWSVLRFHPTFEEYIKYNLTRSLRPGDLMNIWDNFTAIIITGVLENSSDEGQDDDLAEVWGKHCVAAYVNPSPQLRAASYGYRFESQAIQTKKWYEEKKQSTVVESELAYDLQHVCQDSSTKAIGGYLYSACVT